MANPGVAKGTLLANFTDEDGGLGDTLYAETNNYYNDLAATANKCFNNLFADADMVIGPPASSTTDRTLTFKNAGSGVLKVGIGGAPIVALHVRPSTNAYLRITNDGTGHTTADGALIAVHNSNYKMQFINYEDTDMEFRTNDIIGMTINNQTVTVGSNAGLSELIINDLPGADYKIKTGGYDLSFQKYDADATAWVTGFQITGVDANDGAPNVVITNSLYVGGVIEVDRASGDLLKLMASSVEKFRIDSGGSIWLAGGVTYSIDASGNATFLQCTAEHKGSYTGGIISTTYTAAKCTATWPNTYSANQNLNTTNAVTFNNVKTESAEDYNRYSVYGDGSSYSIGMVSAITYGALNDWAMTFRMNADTDRGFWWGHNTHTKAQGAMSLTTGGILTINSYMNAVGGFRVNGTEVIQTDRDLVNCAYKGSTIAVGYTAAKCTAIWPNTYVSNQHTRTTDAPTFAGFSNLSSQVYMTGGGFRLTGGASAPDPSGGSTVGLGVSDVLAGSGFFNVVAGWGYMIRMGADSQVGYLDTNRPKLVLAKNTDITGRLVTSTYVQSTTYVRGTTGFNIGGHKTQDVCSSIAAADEMWSDDFRNVASPNSWRTFTNPRSLMKKIKKKLISDRQGEHLDIKSIPKWIRTVDKKPKLFDEEGEVIEWDKTRKVVHDSSYSINRMQTLLIQALQDMDAYVETLEQRIAVLESA